MVVGNIFEMNHFAMRGEVISFDYADEVKMSFFAKSYIPDLASY